MRAAYPVAPLASFNPDVAHLLACFDELVEGEPSTATPANWRSPRTSP